MSEATVSVQIDADSRVGTLVLNRPEKRNALSAQMVEELSKGLDRLVSEPSIRVVMLRGNGPAFCAGADLSAIQAMQTADFDENLADSRRLANLFLSIAECPKPTIAVVRGPALAGGAGLASACDFVLAGADATIGYPEVKIGFVAAIVMCLLVRQVGERKARYLLLSGKALVAREALELGLVTAVHPPEALDQAALELARSLVKNSPQAMSITKRLLERVWHMPLSDAIDLAAQTNADARGTPDCREGIAAFLERRKPVWKD